jgi:hypothetical protein
VGGRSGEYLAGADDCGGRANQYAARRMGKLLLCVVGLAVGGCVPDYVAPGDYAPPDADADDAAAPVDIASTQPPLATDASPGTSARATSDAGGPATTVGCDLSGRWLVADRQVANGLGAEEAGHEWFYFEMSQTGSQVTVTNGFSCGGNVTGISQVAANVDYHKTWPAMQTYDVQTGRTGTSTATSSGCSVSFEKYYEIIGASVPYYLQNLSAALPTASQEAMGTSPGWQDWDNDGNPGITMNVTGLTTGQIYVSIRKYSQWSGDIAAGSSNFTLADDWDSDTDLLGYSGSSLLTSTASASKDNDASLHFATFARLSATQATGDDTAICTAIRSLAPMLAPKATD